MKKTIVIIVAILIIIAVCVGGFFIWKNNHKNNDNNLSVEEQIKKEYSEKLKEYEDYRIDKVEILSEERTKEIIEWDRGQYYKEGDVLAIITYSIKGDEMAGNGEQSGDWVINKIVCIAFRDGKIVSEGTGW